MLRFEKVATPAVAATAAVPDSVAAAVPVPGVITTVTVPVKPVTVFPRASCAVAFTAGVIATPALVPDGCVEKASCVGGPAATLKVWLVPDARPDAAAWSVKPEPLLSMLNEVKLATPLEALT